MATDKNTKESKRRIWYSMLFTIVTYLVIGPYLLFLISQLLGKPMQWTFANYIILIIITAALRVIATRYHPDDFQL